MGDEPMVRHQTQRRLLFVTVLICLTTVVSHSFGRSTYGLLLPAIEDDFGLTHAEAGIPGTGLYLAYIVGVVLVALTSPRLEPITIMRAGLIVGAVGLGLAAIAPDLAVLTIGVSLAGGAGAGIWMTAPVLATTFVSPARRGLVIGLLSSSIGLSNIILGFGTNALRAALDNDTAWRPIWAIEFLFTATLVTLLILFARFPKTERISGGLSLELLKAVPGWARITLAYALFGGMSAGFGSFILAALEEQGGISRSDSTLVFAVMGIGGVVAAPVAGALSDRFGRTNLMIISLASLVLANGCVAFGTGVAVAVGAVLYGSAAGSFPALMATFVRDHVDNRSFSRVLATMTLLFSLLAALMPSVVGTLADETGSFTASYIVLGILAAGAIAMIASLPKSGPGMQPPADMAMDTSTLDLVDSGDG